jgi:hypothetical protein
MNVGMSAAATAMDAPEQADHRPVRWPTSMAVAVTALVIALVGVALFLDGAHPLSLIGPGANGPSAAAIQQDFPETSSAGGSPRLALPAGIGHDGQQVYAMARNPLSPRSSEQFLDRPAYRWQRPLLPVMAGMLHHANGYGLLWTLVGINLAAVAVGALAISVVAQRFGGSPWSGLVMAVLPGAWQTLRLSTPDVLAVALVVVALAFIASQRPWWAAVAACLAVLAKEPVLLVIIGVALSVALARRSAGFAAAVALLWWALLRLIFVHPQRGVIEFAGPLMGWSQSIKWWLDGRDLIAMFSSALAVMGVVAVWHWRRHHVLGRAIALQAVFVLFLGADVVGLSANGPRALLPLMVLIVVAWASPNWILRSPGATAPTAVSASVSS